ncbi:MAG: glycosyltransferase family 39 protein [Candidatus Eisenbacteria bacterium]|nr:glycosyltransferase family 39 protein [Candidatus Eisenbacteria bacterium]
MLERAIGPISVKRVGLFLAALLLVGALSFLYVTSEAAGPRFARIGLPLDDAWIHQVYARSIAEGRPFQYNPGEPETGATSPLWVILLAPAHLVGIPPVAAAKAAGVLLAAAAAVAAVSLAGRFVGPRLGLAAAASVCLLPYMIFAAVSGTEVPLFVLLLMLTFGWIARGRWRLAGLGAGLSILARPEGYLLLPLLAVARLLHGPRGDRLRGALGTILPALGVIFPWILCCLLATGRPFPSTYYAKAHWFGLMNEDQLAAIASLLLYQPFLGTSFAAPWLRIVLGVSALGLAVAGLRRLAHVQPSAAIAAGLFPFAFLYALSTQLPMGLILGPDEAGSIKNFYFARYLLPGAIALVVLWWMGVGEADRIMRRFLGRAARTGLFSLLMFAVAATLVHQHRIMRAVYSWNCRNIEEQQVAAGRWISEKLPAGASVGVSDAGAIRFFGNHRVIDLLGLNSHRLLPLLSDLGRMRAGSAEEAHLRERFWTEVRPDYLAVTTGWHGALLRGTRAEGIHSFLLDRNTICGGENLTILRPKDSRPNVDDGGPR